MIFLGNLSCVCAFNDCPLYSLRPGKVFDMIFQIIGGAHTLYVVVSTSFFAGKNIVRCVN